MILFVIGFIALYSANGGMEVETDEAFKQLMWFGIGFVLLIIMSMMNYENFQKAWIVIYVLSLISLILVLFTEPNNGATSWFYIGSSFSIQPSEFAKIALILSFSSVLVKLKEKNKINHMVYLLLALVLIAVPTFLIIKQPDFGTAMVILFFSAVMLYTAGISLWYVIGSIVAVGAALPFIYLYVLPEHAKDRITIFLNPETDPLGAGYNIIQSMLAVGSGQIWGMGLFNGNQTQLGYLPMKTTDFIFSVISEEMGFVISVLIVVLFVLFIVRIFYIAKNAKDDFGRLLATGIGGMFLAHFIENIGMTIGLMPITGIPLPFVSYGGSSMMTNCIAIGILLSINRKRKKKMFQV